jgi:hypothetical protein
VNAPEYCLVGIDWWPLCMPKSEWAAWVQAVGSVAAILIAICISRQNERAAAEGARKSGEVFEVTLVRVLQEAHFAARSCKKASLYDALAALRETQMIGHAVPLERLLPAKVVSVSRLRTLCAGSIELLDAFFRRSVPSSPDFKLLGDDLETKLRSYEEICTGGSLRAE